MAKKFDPRDPQDPGPFPDPPDPDAPRPKAHQPPGGGNASDRTVTVSETGRAIPILHGMSKIQGTIIEQYSGVLLAGPGKARNWLPSNFYSIGDRVTANGNAYVATKEGISAGSGAGPSGTGTGIVDGNTSFGPLHQDISVHWDFQSAGTLLSWVQNTAYTVNGMTTVVYANGNLYICVQSGTSAATGSGPSGTDPNVLITDNTCLWHYIPPGWHVSMAVAFCEGQIFGGHAGYIDAGILLDYGAINNNYINLFLGTPTGIGARSALFPTPDTVQRDDYANVAVLLVNAGTGADNKIENIALELLSGTGVDDTHPDENPADIAIDLLTHGRRGAGWSSSRVDTTGTLAIGVASSYRNYCTANGLLLSWVLDTQTTAMDLLGQLLLATNSDVVWSGGKLKFFPRGDQAITANGATYTPVTTPAYNLTSDDIIGVVEVERRSPQSAFNSYPVEYVDRAAGYVRLTVDDKDLANIDQRGLVRAPTVALPQVIAPASAIMLSRIYTQRSIKVMNTYRFRLPYRFLLLDPCDIVTLSDSITGLSAVPVRITAIEEDQGGEGSFLIEAEDYPVAVSAAALYTPQTGDGFGPVRQSSIARAPVLPGTSSATGTLVDSSSTRAAAVHSMWPNGSSEDSPPDGSDPGKPEWAARVNRGVGSAFSGAWVRAIDCTKVGAPSGAPIRLGDQLAGTDFVLGDVTTLTVKVRCSPGQTFRLEAQVQRTSSVGGGGLIAWGVGVNFADVTENVIGAAAANHEPTPGTYGLASHTSTAPANACFVLFRLWAGINGGIGGHVAADFDAINAYQVIDTSSDAASTAPALTIIAASNVFTDIPGTSQSFTPITASRKIKVSLVFSGVGTGAAGNLEVRVVFGGTPTQAGSTYLFSPPIGTHSSWSFLWALPAATLGPVGTAVTVKAQIRSGAGVAEGITLNAADYAAMVVEEIG